MTTISEEAELLVLPTRADLEAEEDAALLAWLSERYPDEIC